MKVAQSSIMKKSEASWYLRISLFLIINVATIGNGFALDTFLPEGQSSIIVRAEYLPDRQAQLDISNIRSESLENQWESLQENFANFGYKPYAYWYRFNITNPTDEPVKHIIEISYPLLDSIDYYHFKGDELVQHVLTGDRLPYSDRLIDHPHFLFPISLRAGESGSFYLRVMSAGSQLVPLKLWDSTNIFIYLGKEDSLHAIYLGVVSVVIFFNMLIFFALREKMYLYYAISTLVLMLFFAIMRAKLYPYVFSDTPAFHHFLLLILPSSCLFFAAIFSREFLSIRKYSKYANYAINFIIAICLACMAGVFIFDSQTSLKLSVLSVIPGSFILLLLGPIIALMGNRVAWVYTLAWGSFMFGVAVTALSKQGFLPVNFMTEYGMQLGSVFEVFILNAALAYRFYRAHVDKITAQEARILEHTERRGAEVKLLHNSMSDAVTMMPNRSSFELQIFQVINERDHARIGICIIEITRYSEISKTLGHQNTDLMMREVAHHFNKALDLIPARIHINGPSFKANLCALESGSFGVLMNMDGAESDANRDNINQLLHDLSEPIEFKDMRLELQPVIGVAVCPEHGLNAATLLRHAQVAADSSDAFERSLSYYRPEYDQYNARRLTMISELKEALNANQLELYFQPKYCLENRRVIGVEALVRWHHERYGLVRPDEFIELAEQTGIIKPLTRWVVRNALAHQAELLKQGYDLSMSINLSTVNLKEQDLIPYLEALIQEIHADPCKIYLELTETSMMSNPLDAIEVLDEIRKIGIKISIDDFGSGYSSLAYLKALPANEIKIDKSLVFEICRNTRSEIIAKMTIDMCHELGFTVVAEGVETQEVMDRLMDLNCDVIQGYLLTPPLPVAKLINWLNDDKESQGFAT
ncbi:MAG: EAL domain-containing protein (putative c-di-GMP-specific phosphodiesterase class I) [Oleiphilaceae bacterium]|jgi:EAL domain-containing protein (putative c-di-GMP-specific phosphodiesterase class I)/GGDEF domain-containing protein